MAVDEELEPLCEPRLGSVPLGERRHDLRVVDNEGGVHALHLKEMAHQLEEEENRGGGVRGWVRRGGEIHTERERGHDQRVMENEGGVYTLHLKEMAHLLRQGSYCMRGVKGR